MAKQMVQSQTDELVAVSMHISHRYINTMSHLTNGVRSSGTRRSDGLLTGGGVLVRMLSVSGVGVSCATGGSGTVSTCIELC